MLNKFFFLNVLVISFLILSGCGSAINVKLAPADSSGVSISVSTAAPAAAPAAAPVVAPANGGISNNILLFIVVGLVGVIVIIALIAVIGSKRSNNS